MRSLFALALAVLLAAPVAAEITLPCAVGPTGAQGPTGGTGPTGDTGPTGASAGSVASTTHIWFPGYPQGVNDSTWGGSNVLLCVSWVPEVGITNATKIAHRALGDNTCGIAVYSADGSTRLVTTGGTDCTANPSNVVASGLSAFSFTEGTKYQVCWCSTSGTMHYLGTPTGGDHIQALSNAMTVPITTTAANACSSGAPPTTTGTLTVQNTGAGTMYILFSTE